MFKIFISEPVFKRVVLSESKKPKDSCSSLYKLMRGQKPIYVSVDSSDTAWIQTFSRDPGLTIDVSKSAYIKNIATNSAIVLENPSSLFILDISPYEALAIQRSYGVLCLSGEQPNISPLIDVNDVHIANACERLGRGWDSVLDSVEPLPSNALLLTDRYLFAFRHPNAGDGIANIHDILNELLPLDFQGGDYHVTIIFDNMSRHASYTFEDIATQLNRLKLQLRRDYPIMMEVLGVTPDCSIYNKLHNRLILSNYYLVEASHKLAAFNENRGTARQMLIPWALFTESSLNGQSTPPLKAIDQTLSSLRHFSKSLTDLTDHSVYFYAVNGKCMEKCMSIRNRLIK